MTPEPLMPRQPVPALHVPLTTGKDFILGSPPADQFDLLVFYRGFHCPICAKYLLELERIGPEFARRGVRATAISSDGAERARKMADKISARNVQIAYGLELRSARSWGLYISTGRGPTSAGVEEPALFSEPGLFLVRPDGTLYYGSTQSMPFARPPFSDLLGAVDYALEKSYPARGEFDGELPPGAAA